MRRLKSPSINIRGVVFGVVVVCVFGTAAFGQPWDGNGVEGDPYQIWTAADMQAIGADSNYWDKHFRLCADIDLSAYTGTSFNIIGDAYFPPYDTFTGVFDGNGHTVSNFSWESDVYSRAIGLFGYVSENGVIGDLRVENAEVNAPNCNRVSALVGETSGSPMIINCFSSGTVKGDFYIGGIAGDLSGQAIRCYSSCTVSGGGVGVITGHVDGSLTDSFAAGVVLGTEQAGGLAGRNYGTITNCYSFGVINSSGYLSGGLVGINGGTIFNSYSQADVQGTDDVGGLAGKNHPQGIIENCYSTGTVNGTTDVGGLLGYNNGGTLASCFWDSDVNPDVNGIGNTTDPNVIGETTANMQTENTFTDAGWDFVGEVINGPNDVWTICEGEDYPRLAWEKYGGGNGTEANPYLIRTSCQMNAIGADSNYWDAHFKLMADIDLSSYTGTSFNIIGERYYDSGWVENPFTGVFDGNGHTISNFTYDSNGIDYIGLFGYVDDPNAQIMNLRMVDPNVDAGSGSSAGRMIGSLVGYLENGTITGCRVEGCRLQGAEPLGGMVARNSGLVTDCYAEGTVIGTYVSDDVGVLVGISWYGDVIGCSSAGFVQGRWDIGGLVGNLSYGVMKNCYSQADVNGIGAVGGLVGHNYYGTITDCWSTGTASGLYGIGGLLGENVYSTASDCYATGTVDGSEQVGGFVGYNMGEVSNCYSVGRVSGTDFVGGFVGYHYNSGYTKSFWDSDINPDVNGIGNTTDPNVIGESTANMQTESTFTDAGWDFNTPIWKMCDGPDYPKLGWEECPEAATLLDVVSTMLDPNSLKNENMKNALINKINAALKMIDEGLYEDALGKLENDILAKTNGCAETGEPDKNDWIISCEEQSEVYPLIIETIEYVRSLME